jgi:WD40 repeat protein
MPRGVNESARMVAATRVHETATGRPAGPPLQPGGVLLDAALSPDGRHAITLSSSVAAPEQREAVRWLADGRASTVQVWDWRTGTRAFDPVRMPSEPHSVACSPDGTLLAVICAGGEILLLDSATGRVVRQMNTGVRSSPSPPDPYRCNCAVCFSPDGRLLASWDQTRPKHGWSVQVWDVAAGQRLHPPLPHEGRIFQAQFSPDGQFLATAAGAGDPFARVWDMRTGQLAAPPLEHADTVCAVRFSADGRRLLTGCRDGSVGVWDWRTGRRVFPPFQQAGEVYDVVGSADGRWVITASAAGRVLVLDADSGKPVTPPLLVRGMALNVALTPDGSRVLVAGVAGVVFAFDLRELTTPDEVDVNDLCLLSELVFGQHLRDGGSLENLSREEWLQRWRAFRERGRPGLPGRQVP